MQTYIHNKNTKIYIQIVSFPDGSNSKESACDARDLGLVHGSGRSPGEGNSPLQYSCLKNSVDKEPGRL